MTELIKVNRAGSFNEVRRIASLVVGRDVELDKEIIDGVRFELVHPQSRWPDYTILGISLGVDDANFKMHYQRVMVTREGMIDLDKLKAKFESQKELAKKFAEEKIAKDKRKKESTAYSIQLGKTLEANILAPGDYFPSRNNQNNTSLYMLLISFKEEKELLEKLQNLVNKLQS